MHTDTAKGATYIVLSSLAFATMGFLIKQLGNQASQEQVVFFRNFFSFILLFPVLIKNMKTHFSTELLRFHFVRGFAGVTSMYCYFIALGHLSLASAVALSYSAPLFTPAIALIWLNEKTSPRQFVLVFIGFIGVASVLQPGFQNFSFFSLVALASGFFAAIAMVSIRRMANHEPAIRIVFYFSLIATIVSSFPLFYAWQPLSVEATFNLFVIAAVATFGQFALTKGYMLAKVAFVGPYTYTTVIFAGIFGWLAWHEFPNSLATFGIFLIIVSGILGYQGVKNQP